MADVDECKESIGQALGMPVDNHWTVTGLMLTRNVEPAAFVRNPRVIYCVLGDLVTLMALDDLPSPGFYDGDASSNESHVPGVAT